MWHLIKDSEKAKKCIAKLRGNAWRERKQQNGLENELKLKIV